MQTMQVGIIFRCGSLEVHPLCLIYSKDFTSRSSRRYSILKAHGWCLFSTVLFVNRTRHAFSKEYTRQAKLES